MASLRYSQGPVGLRPSRDAVQMTVQGVGKVTIAKGWLRERQNEYHKCVSQAIMLGATEVKLFDAADPFYKNYTPEAVAKLTERRDMLLQGKGQIAVPDTRRRRLSKIASSKEREKDILVKFSKNMCPAMFNRRERAFLIENGELLVYKGRAQHARLKAQYNMKEAKVYVEKPTEIQYPVWDAGFELRLRVDTQERQNLRKPPVYLYAKDKTKVERWKRAFQLAKILTSQNDRVALRTSIGRATSGSLIKGWEALFAYSREVSSTKNLVKQMAMRLMKVEISRGYTKLRMAYKEKLEAREIRLEQQLWAARFMSEKLAKLGDQSAKSAADVREQVITRIQQKFRRYRDDRIFERTYPLNSAQAASKSQQAKLGRKIDFTIKAVECRDAMQLSFPKGSEEAKMALEMSGNFKTRKPTYSEVNLPVSTVHVYVSDNLTSLSFSGNLDGVGHDSLTKAAWSNFINLDRIGSVVLFSEPARGAQLKDESDSKDAGVWFTINGPRLGWGKKIDPVTKTVKGVSDGLKVMEKLGKKEQVWWQEMTLTISEASLSRKAPAPEGSKLVNIRVVAHAFGYAFEKLVAPSQVEDSLDGDAFTVKIDLKEDVGFPVAPDDNKPALSAAVEAGAREIFVANGQGLLPGDEIEIGGEKAVIESVDAPSFTLKAPLDGDFTAGTALTKDPGYSAILESSEVGIEVYEIREYASRPEGNKTETQLIYTGSERVPTILGYETGELPPDFADRPQEDTYKMLVAEPFKIPDPKAEDAAHVQVQIVAKKAGLNRSGAPAFLGDRGVPLSPEFVGGGVTTAVFTSHRGAWYDPALGHAKFRADHVSNYVELSLQALRFPKKDVGDLGRRYRIKASMCGCSALSPTLTRPKEGWAKVNSLGQAADPKAFTQVIKFMGSRIYLPLPPGCWCQGFEDKRKIHIQVLRDEESTTKPMNYKDFVGSARAGKITGGKDPAIVYEAFITFDMLLVDLVRPVSAYLGEVKAGRAGKKMPTVNAMDNTSSGETTDGCLNMDFALRDRDYVKAVTGGTPATQPEMAAYSEKRSLCIGDRAMLVVEEPITYPPTSLDGRGGEDYGKREFRKRFFHGTWSKETSTKANESGNIWPGEKCGLRPPCLSSEYAESGLGTLEPKVTFQQSFIPNHCTDVMPHEFVMPATEKTFLNMHLPGVYPKIMDDLASMPEDSKSRVRLSKIQRPTIKRLSHLTRKIPVTLLATYADGTCDIEIFGEFMKHWQKEPYRRYCIPGGLKSYRAPPGQAGAPPRALLKRVPLSQVCAVHGTGFNIYDASLKKSDDVVDKKPPPEQGFDLRKVDAASMDSLDKGSKFSLSAGPLPPDASHVACEYEWSVKMRAANETEMYKFVAMLRRCVRLDGYQQASKMLEYQLRAAAEAPARQNQAQQRTMVGGQLEVLLVEARRLKPPQALLNRPELLLQDRYLEVEGTTAAGKMIRNTPKGNAMISTYVNFRMLNPISGSDGMTEKMDVIPYKGQKVQQSLKCHYTDSPNWAAMEEYRGTGGCLFRTGLIDPQRLPYLQLGLEVMYNEPWSLKPKMLGYFQIPVAKKDFLVNPEEPLRNLWVPLVSMPEGGGAPMANKTGELHIMCRWLPADKIPTTPGAPSAVSVRSQFQKEIWPRVCAQRLREPIYNIEVQYLRYTPNLVRGGDRPEAHKDFIQRHAEELCNASYYLECLERRNKQAWQAFENALGDLRRVRLGELRLKWLAEDSSDMVQELHELIQRGIPSTMRTQKWSELSLASRVMEREGIAGHSRPQPKSGMQVWEVEYATMLDRGMPQRSDAMLQLQEDAFNLASWESSTPPIPELFAVHLRRVRSAQNVCTALIATQQYGSGIVYCESLLVIAFFLLLPQGSKEPSAPEDAPLQSMSESDAFWLLYTLISTRLNGTYKEYYGTPQPTPSARQDREELVSTSGAMHDVTLLECCLSYHLPEVWGRMNALGFQLASVFYGAFMRLYATYMPTSTVLRVWDLLFAASTDPKAQPHARIHLVDLAFGVIKSKGADLLLCESATEIRDLILGVLGSIYDMSTAVDIIMMANTFLWGGGGFSSGKVGFLWTQRDDMFKIVNTTTAAQNEVLKALCQVEKLGTVHGKTPEAGAQAIGVTTKDLQNDVLRVLHNTLDKKGQQPKTWFMHRPQPLATRMLCENSLDQAWNMINKQVHEHSPYRPQVPRQVAPAPAMQEGKILEPAKVSETDLVHLLEKEIPSWKSYGGLLYRAFQNRQDVQYPNLGYAPPGWHNDPKVGAAPGQSVGFWESLRKEIGLDNPPPDESNDFDLSKEPVSMSVNELFVSLIAASKGTLGEKAAAFFQLFSYKKQGPKEGSVYHVTPVTKLARSLTNTADANSAVDTNLAPPEIGSEDASKHVLLFTVFSNHPVKNQEVGRVYIPSLAPYVAHETTQAEFHHFNIWGKPAGKNVAGTTLKNSSGIVYSFTPKISASSNDVDPTVLMETMKMAFEARGMPANVVELLKLDPLTQRGEIVMKISGDPRAVNHLRVNAKKLQLPEAGLTATAEEADRVVCVGDMEMALTWTPKSISNPQKGQLMIHLRSIKFHKYHVSDYYKMNPWVKVKTFVKKSGADGKAKHEESDIKRWDPRGLLKKDGQQSWLTTHGPYGGVIGFDQTMRDGMFSQQGHNLSNYRFESEGMGLKDEKWTWNDTWGKQYSIEDLQVQQDFAPTKVIDLHAVRLIVTMILQRSMLNVTNRQAILIADSVFNRNGVVPGIIEACLVEGNHMELKKKYKSLAALKAAVGEAGVIDITNKMAIEHERQIAFNGGCLNLFTDGYMGTDLSHELRTVTLESMNIKDAFPQKQKCIWLRFVRGGDGERCTEVIPVDSTGTLDGYDVPGPGGQPKRSYEVQLEVMDLWPHTKLQKEEFVTCMLSSPLVSESLRRLGSSVEQPMPRRTVSLDVTIMDPHQEEEEEQFMEGVNIGQSLLFEVWDADTLSKDFLGEAWLPPLSSLGPRLKDLVLPLEKARFDREAENGPSREDPKKNIGDDSNDATKKVTGEVYVSVSWKYPAYVLEEQEGSQAALYKLGEDGNKMPKPELQGDREDIHIRARMQEKLHTGTLDVRIHRAKNLRRADASKGRACDPQVLVYVRNDVSEPHRWRKKPFMRTPVRQNNRNPEWNFKETKELLTGEYENRFPPVEEGFFAEAKQYFTSRKSRRNTQELREAQAVKKFANEGLKVRFFGSDETPESAGAPGSNHKVDIFSGDSIANFRTKLSLACQKEAEYWKRAKGEHSKEAELFADISITYKHLVMAFIPPAKVQRLREQKMQESEEYKRAIELAYHDPSCWQPLDPIRTFAQYPEYGFGRARQIGLRVVEATEGYKLNNLRYKQYDREQATKGFHDKDDSDSCFAWAKYVHESDHSREVQDGDTTRYEPSFEWRPCVAKLPEAKDARPKDDASYKIVILSESIKTEPKPGDWPERAEPAKQNKEFHAKQDVLLKPRIPKLDSLAAKEHMEFLPQAELLRKYGKSDFEIAETLQKLLKESWQKNNPDGVTDGRPEPPPITVDVIRSYIQQLEFKAAKEKEDAARAK